MSWHLEQAYMWIDTRFYCIVNVRVIVAFINSSLYSCMSHKQDKEMDNLNLFIDYHYKSIVSIIRVKHILTLHLSTANWRIKLTTGCCCKNAAAHYAIYFCLVESIPQFLELWPISMHFHGTSNFTLLYRNATTYGINILIKLGSEGGIDWHIKRASCTININRPLVHAAE